MESGVRTTQLNIGGMTCANCQRKIERKLQGTRGVKKAAVSYRAETATITYDSRVISLKAIGVIIEKLGYHITAENERRQSRTGRIAGTLVIIVSLYALLQQFSVLNLLVPSQLSNSAMSYGMIFVIGLITSLHCVAMCGGINLSQSIPRGDMSAEKKNRFTPFVPTLLYNLGRVSSYTFIGFILGFVGLLAGGGSDAGLPSMPQGILKLIAGVFMIVMGINMLGLFPGLRALTFSMPKRLAHKIDAKTARNKGPLLVGLLNGLMPCGPLQSMQIVALASGNPLAGALSLFLFSLGTTPLMFGLGSLVSALGTRFTRTVTSVGAVLVVVLGLAMLSQGGSLSGLLLPDRLLPIILALCAVGVVSSLPFRRSSYKIISTLAACCVAGLVLVSWNQISAAQGNPAANKDITIVDGRQAISSTLASGRYPNITVQAGTPVTWIIDAPEGSINGCNSRMFIQEYGIEHSFTTGENIVEFTPTTAKTVPYTCWMGMIRGNITVTEAGAS